MPFVAACSPRVEGLVKAINTKDTLTVILVLCRGVPVHVDETFAVYFYLRFRIRCQGLLNGRLAVGHDCHRHALVLAQVAAIIRVDCLLNP